MFRPIRQCTSVVMQFVVLAFRLDYISQIKNYYTEIVKAYTHLPIEIYIYSYPDLHLWVLTNLVKQWLLCFAYRKGRGALCTDQMSFDLRKCSSTLLNPQSTFTSTMRCPEHTTTDLQYALREPNNSTICSQPARASPLRSIESRAATAFSNDSSRIPTEHIHD